MSDLSLVELINLFLAIIALVPAIVIVKQYRRTGIDDYLLFAGAFFTFSILLTVSFIGIVTNWLFIMQLDHWLYNSLFFLWFLHSVRMRWDRTPRIVWYTGVIWYSILMFLILFWEGMSPQPEQAIVLFMEMPHTHSTYYPFGAGIMTSGGVIIYSTAHGILRLLFHMYVWAILLYAYWTVKPVYSSERIILARRLMIFAGLIGLIYMILSLPWLPEIPLLNAILFVGFGLVIYVAIRIPEGLVLSQVQIIRAVGLYKQVKDLSSELAVKRFGMPSLVEYLQNIPPEIIGYTWESLEQ